jgi:hypothetical protein
LGEGGQGDGKRSYRTTEAQSLNESGSNYPSTGFPESDFRDADPSERVDLAGALALTFMHLLYERAGVHVTTSL